MIYKYGLDPAGSTVLDLPRGSRVLDVQNQGDSAQMWVLLSNEPMTERRRFYVVVTGAAPASPLDAYIGTVQILEGAFVAHIFEEMSPL